MDSERIRVGKLLGSLREGTYSANGFAKDMPRVIKSLAVDDSARRPIGETNQFHVVFGETVVASECFQPRFRLPVFSNGLKSLFKH